MVEIEREKAGCAYKTRLARGKVGSVLGAATTGGHPPCQFTNAVPTGTTIFQSTNDAIGARFRAPKPNNRQPKPRPRSGYLSSRDATDKPKKTTDFATFVNETYLPWSKLNKRSARNDVGYCRVLCEAFGGKDLAEITPFLIEQFKRKRTESPTRNGNRRAPATTNRELACLSKVFSLAQDHEVIAANPCKRVKRVGGETARNRYLSLDEETRLVAACTGTISHLRDLVVMAIQTGMRRGEILGLQWAHVDFERRALYIHRSKSGKPRSVPMSDEVYRLLFNRQTSSTWVFTHPYHPGQRLTEFKRAWDTACRRANLTDLRFHDLRHTAATRLAECGVEAFTIAGILGHSSIQTSARYAHASDAGKRRAVDFLAGYGKNVTNLPQNKKSGTF